MDTTLRALNRFGLGARVGERDAIGDPKRWLEAQVEQGDSSAIAGPDVEEINGLLLRLREAQRARERDRTRDVVREMRELLAAEVHAVLTERLVTQSPFVERLVAFWSNHLCVSAPTRRQVTVYAGHYERTAIRPHVLGRFEEMVLASAKHPAMLFYLDNFRSVGPGSPVGVRTARRGNVVGLNENYARELMELHTVGVDGGYEQEDVQQLARVLTGWSVAAAGPGNRREEVAGFVFRGAAHEPGVKRVLGRSYGPSGIREGEEVIRDLCAHPSTADFVAGKLVRHFVSDDPPEAAVRSIATAFRDSGGDLSVVSRALIDLDAAWQPEQRKVRTPQDWLTAVFRAVRVEEPPEQMARQLRQLRHSPWSPLAPNGFGDGTGEWTDPAALMNRVELARSLAGRVASADRIDPEALLGVVDVEPSDPLRDLVSNRRIGAAERIALIVGSPAFQWR